MAATFRYYRLRITKLRDTPALATAVQISEFGLVHAGTRVLATTATVAGGSSPVGEEPSKANDNNTATKWLDGGKLVTLTYDFTTAKTFDGFFIATSNDFEERDPVRWAVEGSSDNVTWTMLQNQTLADYPITTARLTATPIIMLAVNPEFLLSML